MASSPATNGVSAVTVNGNKKARPNPRRRATEGRGSGALPKAASTASKCEAPGNLPGSLKQQAKSCSADSSISKPSSAKSKHTKQGGNVKSKPARNTGSQASSSAAKSASISHDCRAQDRATSVALAPPAMVTGGLLGCAAGAAVLLGTGLWKNFAGTENAILTARSAKLCIDNLIEETITSLKAGTYNAPEALDMLRRTTLAYASSFPGGTPLVERIFREVDMVRRQRGAEVDRVLEEAYSEIADAQKKGATLEQVQTIVFKQVIKLSTFATNATQDVLARNPRWRPFRDDIAKTLRGVPSQQKVPTVKVNMAVRHKILPVK